MQDEQSSTEEALESEPLEEDVKEPVFPFLPEIKAQLVAIRRWAEEARSCPL